MNSRLLGEQMPAPLRSVRFLSEVVLLLVIGLATACGKVEKGEDLSGYYTSRSLSEAEVICLRRDGTFAYRSPGERGGSRVQFGQWQPVAPFAGSLIAVLDTVDLYQRTGTLYGPDGPEPGIFLEARRTLTRAMVLIPPGDTGPLFRRAAGENECPIHEGNRRSQ